MKTDNGVKTRESLKELRESKFVAAFEYDMEQQTVSKMMNMSVHGLEIKPDGIQFIYRPNSLPMPLDDETKKRLSSFKRETIRICGLSKGKYRLMLDRLDAGRYTAAQLQRGIQIAELEENPNLQRARYIHRLNEKMAELEKQYPARKPGRKSNKDMAVITEFEKLTNEIDRASKPLAYKVELFRCV